MFDLVSDNGLSFAPEIVCRPPASQGDIARAVLQGATIIGLVDGRYEDVAAPWHKEILFALEEGAVVMGAGSLGALRAAECAPFGMIGIGQNFQRYCSGELVDDADVAQLHAPAEYGCFPVTEAFVNVEATIRQTEAVGEISPADAAALLALARKMFFKDLTFEELAERFHSAPCDADYLFASMIRNRVDIKRRDAIALVQAMLALPDCRTRENRFWRLAEPAAWRSFLAQLKAEIHRSPPLNDASVAEDLRSSETMAALAA